MTKDKRHTEKDIVNKRRSMYNLKSIETKTLFERSEQFWITQRRE